MASAYANAEGGHYSKELEDLYLIERFGVQAIKNRQYLGKKELKDMLLAEGVKNSYLEKENSDNVVEWIETNPERADLVHAAYKAAKELGMVNND